MFQDAGEASLLSSVYINSRIYQCENENPYPLGFYSLFKDHEQKWREVVCVLYFARFDDSTKMVVFMDSFGEVQAMPYHRFFNEEYDTPRGVLPRYHLERKEPQKVDDEGRQFTRG